MKTCNISDLLEKGADCGYPLDYLLSRIRGRKARLITDWKSMIASMSPLEQLPQGHYQRIAGDRSPEGIWRALLSEYRWVYYQMNGQVRNVFAPFFAYAELRTLFICLRNLKEMKKARVREMLSATLLSDEIKSILVRSDDEMAAARDIEEKLSCFSGRFSGIAEILHQEGLNSFEHELAVRFLSVVVGAGLNPVLHDFFRRLIDARNMMALAKLLKLGTTAEHSFIPGGTIGHGKLRDVLGTNDRATADRLLRKFTGEEAGVADLAGLEVSLYRGISRHLKKQGRATLSISAVLDYLWRCSTEAMNLSVLSYGQGLERDVVATELVR